MPRILFSAGEASGDAYGGALAGRLTSSWQIEAIGGRRLCERGADMIASSERWGAIGIIEAFRVGPRVLRGLLAAKRRISEGTPGIFVPIDYGFFNIRLARHAKSKGWHVLYFIPPGSWRRHKQGADLPTLCDDIVTPFSWSKDLLDEMAAQESAACRVHYFGHPLKQMIAERRATFGTPERTRIAILPGSRMHEVTHNLPVIAEAVAGLDIELEFAVAATLSVEELSRSWTNLSPRGVCARFTEGDTYGVLLSARAAIVCSGTATLEAALCGCPCTVMYRGSRLMEWEYRLRKPKFDYISLPNILADRAVVPERIQWDATPQRVRSDLEPLLVDGPEREAQLQAFQRLDHDFGPANAIDHTVSLLDSLTQP